MGTWKNKKWRRVMMFICKICGKERKTFNYETATDSKICKTCQKTPENLNQITIFDKLSK